jgi:hypothetical protein
MLLLLMLSLLLLLLLLMRLLRLLLHTACSFCVEEAAALAAAYRSTFATNAESTNPSNRGRIVDAFEENSTKKGHKNLRNLKK